MRVEMLTVPDCRNGPVLRARLTAALSGHPGVGGGGGGGGPPPPPGGGGGGGGRADKKEGGGRGDAPQPRKK
ncbi:hypothetical protein ABH932_003679, partial [Streptacidiphilus sp. MAP5-52]